jgi:DNA-binding CsgD family transcriptional regulator
VAAPVGFVGRERELSRLRAVATGGDARLLLVMGDAGVGKTRLVSEGMRRVAADGVVAVWGGCLPMRETLPLLPVADALAELSRVDGGELLDAALTVTPRYVRAEVERLLPRLGSGAVESSGLGDSGQRDRLFAAIAELLGAVAQRRRVALIVEDVHWADAATLDFLTFLTRAHRDAALPVIATCRSDEAPLDPQVTDWLAQVRGRGGVAEVRLGPLSREEVAEQVAELAGAPAPAPVVDELYARAEGNPFFTEQLVAAVAGSSHGALRPGLALPARLAELLVARAGHCGAAATAVLSALAVAGRPLSEDLLGTVSGLDVDAVRGGLRELTAARLLADGARDEQRPRHALLAEAVAAGLLPGERAALHERVAGALQATGDDTLAAEAAGHWAAAGRAAEELPARVRAAEAAERLFGYAEAARHWQRAIELFQGLPDAEQLIAADLPRLYLRALDALQAAGEGERRGALAEEAYRRFADHPDPAVAAVIHLHAAWFDRSPADARPLYEQALRLFERVPPSAEHAKAWNSYAQFLLHAEGREDARRAALTRGLEVAEAAGATGIAAVIQVNLAHDACLRGQVTEGFAIAERARALAEASGDGAALAMVAGDEADLLLKTGRFEEAAEAGLRGVRAARESGRYADLSAANAAEAMLARGRTAEAAELIDPLTDAPPDPFHYPVHGLRAEIDLLRGDVGAAAGRLWQIRSVVGSIDDAGEIARLAAEVTLWAGRPGEGLAEVQGALARYQATDWAIQCGWLLVVGMRACADLAGQGRARRDESAVQAALAASAELAACVDQLGGAPFTDHPYVATIPAARATWDAERSRLAGPSDPAAWHTAAKTWDDLGCPHRAGYAWWRHAEARLLAGQPPAAAAVSLRAAAAAADGHAPLLSAIHALAERAHIALVTASVTAEAPQPHAEAARYGLTGRELLVLRLLAAGRTNPQIGAELFISPKTASVHVTNILHKLGVSTRVQAAALAERAGLLDLS